MRERAMMTRWTRLQTRRPSRRLAWLALLAMLLQLVAFAVYACPDEQNASTPATATMAGCEGMEMPDPNAPALCDQHCLRDHVTQPDLKALQVPLLALPPMRFAWVASRSPEVGAQQYEDVPPCLSDPPPAQRFCSLQI